jgi:circadian clock protein KaiB
VISSDLPIRGPDAPQYKLRLFIAGTSPRSRRTIENLKRICDRYLVDRLDLEVVDIYQRPDLAERDQVVAAPTLVKLAPAPIRRIIGDLSDEPRVLRALELPFEANDYVL